MKKTIGEGKRRWLLCLVMMWSMLFLFPMKIQAENAVAVTEENMQGIITADSSLNIRKGPGKEYDIITAVDNDTVLLITGRTDNGWYRVEAEGQEGFVSEKYVDAQPLPEMEEEAGEPEEGAYGAKRGPDLVKIIIIGVGIVAVLAMLTFTVRGMNDEDDDDEDEEDDDDDDEDDDEEDDEDDDDEEGDDEDDDDEEDGDEEDDDVRIAAAPGNRAEYAGSTDSLRREYIIREEDYRVNIDPSFFEEKEVIEQPDMVTGYLERKKIEEAVSGFENKLSAEEEKQRELEQAMEKLNELQKEIERLKKK